MRTWTKASGLIFLAAASVYSGRAIGATPGKSAKAPAVPENKNIDVKLLEDNASEPLFGAAPATQPTTNPAAAGATASIESAAVNANVDGTFSLNITNGADLGETLRVIGFQAQKSVLPSKDVKASLPALDLYNVTVHEALDAILRVNGYVYKEQGNFIYVYSAKEAADMEKAARTLNTEVFRLYYTNAANALTLVKPMLSEGGQVATTTPAMSGISSGTGDVGGNSHATEDVLVITDYADNLDKIRKVLKDIDRRPQQILIEATILRAALSEDNALGIDFNVVSGVDFANLTTSNGQITNSSLGTGSIATNGGNVSSVGTGNTFSSSIPPGLKVGFLNNNVSVFLNALEGVTDTAVLANPKVLALNKQKGEVIVGRKDGYLTTTTTDTSTVQTVDFLDTGTRLVFRPFIGDDGYIRMEIHPEDSSGGLSGANLPFKITTEVTSNIMVKDGRTVVIGGLFRESSTTGRNQVPGLGSIPGVGMLFRQQRDQTTREEIIILLTPHIVKDDAAYSEASEALLKQGEQMRVGVRKGMMWWGRERLAESAYECALSELSKANPDRNKALWHLDCATNLNPKFIEAIQLKQEITGVELTEADNATARGFVRRQILSERLRMRDGRAASSKSVDEHLMSAQATTMSPATQPSMKSSQSAMSSSEMAMSEQKQSAAPVEEHSQKSAEQSDSMQPMVTETPAIAMQQQSQHFAAAPAVKSNSMPVMPAAESEADAKSMSSMSVARESGARQSAPLFPSMMSSFARVRSMFGMKSEQPDTTVTELPMDDVSQK